MTDRLRLAGQPYRPSNGTEGEGFYAVWCNECWHERAFESLLDGKKSGFGCAVLGRTMLYEISDPLYPKEWVFDAEGMPSCTAFVNRKERAQEAARKAQETKRRILDAAHVDKLL